METQLELFKELLIVPQDKSDYSNLYEFMCSLPLFYFGHTKPDVYEIERRCFYRGNEYIVKIKRTRLSKNTDAFLNAQDLCLMDCLIFLSGKEETEKEVVDGRLRIKLTIYKIFKTLNHKMSYNDIKTSLAKLHQSHFEIKPVQTTSGLQIRWNCASIISQYLIKDERHRINEKVEADYETTYIEFNKEFSQELLKGKIKLINFYKMMSITSNIGKYVYKKLVLADCFSTSNIFRTYHNKSLIQFLENGGFPCDTVQDKNNNFAAFKRSIIELQRKNLVQSVKMRACKDGNRIVDYFFEITPSMFLISENHKQRKVKRFKKKYIK